ncbi:MAG: hypothetical protein SNJ77_11090 [Cytophagales bacterium]
MFKRVSFWLKRQFVKMKQWPKPLKISLGVLFVLIGILNIPNPLVNGILLILLGARLLFSSFKSSKERKFLRK